MAGYQHSRANSLLLRYSVDLRAIREQLRSPRNDCEAYFPRSHALLAGHPHACLSRRQGTAVLHPVTQSSSITSTRGKSRQNQPSPPPRIEPTLDILASTTTPSTCDVALPRSLDTGARDVGAWQAGGREVEVEVEAGVGHEGSAAKRARVGNVVAGVEVPVRRVRCVVFYPFRRGVWCWLWPGGLVGSSLLGRCWCDGTDEVW